jgi:hypothetical protein
MELTGMGFPSIHPPSSALDAEFPSKPVWNTTNDWMDHYSRQKIVQAPFYGGGDSGYGDMMNEYCR